MAVSDVRVALRERLLDAGLLIDTGVDGLYGRSGTFEDIVSGIDRMVDDAGKGKGFERVRFSPVFPRAAFEKTDYLASFPDLTGSIHTFPGDDKDHAALLAAQAAGADWSTFLVPGEIVLVSAACHPLYAGLTGTLPEGGRSYDVQGYCFRHEPSLEPTRLQAFRMHEYVRIDTPQSAYDHREEWVDRGLELLTALGLKAEPEIANDPFFGRAGRMLKANQRNAALKMELVIDVYGDGEGGVACVSSNCHQDHFGVNYEIRTNDGEVAHSACVGFGLERIALALLSTHGFDPDRWPAEVRDQLWP